MSDFPIALHGERVSVVVFGGGAVGARKAMALIEAGASVTVVAPVVVPDLEDAEQMRRVNAVCQLAERA